MESDVRGAGADRRRLILLVSVTILVESLFFTALAPLLPYYADRFDLSKSAAGILAGGYAAGTLVGSVPGGWLAARIGARGTVLVGLTAMSVASIGMAFGKHIVILDAARVLQGV